MIPILDASAVGLFVIATTAKLEISDKLQNWVNSNDSSSHNNGRNIQEHSGFQSRVNRNSGSKD
jgi:hypothetical protein